MLRAFVELEPLDGIALSSSVPQLVREYDAFAERWAGVDLLVSGPGVSTGVTIRYDDPREVGNDRMRTRSRPARATERHGRGRFRHLDGLPRRLGGRRVRGGRLAPGIEVFMDALFARAARLPLQRRRSRRSSALDQLRRPRPRCSQALLTVSRARSMPSSTRPRPSSVHRDVPRRLCTRRPRRS